ncbi:unnamed protein product [Closterium sp. NIES-65]|nr:unnamed protein product [Closterium sp. NIES-65]
MAWVAAVAMACCSRAARLCLSICISSIRHTPCSGLTPSAKPRMTALPMLLPGLLVALVLGGAAIALIPIISKTPLGMDAWRATTTAADTPIFVLVSGIATPMVLLWWMGMTLTQGRAWAHQQGLALMAGLTVGLLKLMKLKSANKWPVPRGIFPLLRSTVAWIQRAGEVIGTVTVGMAGRHKMSEAKELSMRAIGVQLEEKRRELAVAREELEEAESRTEEGLRELREFREELAELKRALREQELVVTQLEEAEERKAAELRELREQVEERKRGLEEAERRRMAEMSEMRGQVEGRERELAAVKGEMSEHKDAVRDLLDMAERRRESDLRDLREEARKGKDEMRAELAREREERRREVQELNWPRAMEELAACRSWQIVELEISQSEGHRKIAWEVRVERLVDRMRTLLMSTLDHSLSFDVDT